MLKIDPMILAMGAFAVVFYLAYVVLFIEVLYLWDVSVSKSVAFLVLMILAGLFYILLLGEYYYLERLAHGMEPIRIPVESLVWVGVIVSAFPASLLVTYCALRSLSALALLAGGVIVVTAYQAGLPDTPAGVGLALMLASEAILTIGLILALKRGIGYTAFIANILLMPLFYVMDLDVVYEAITGRYRPVEYIVKPLTALVLWSILTYIVGRKDKLFIREEKCRPD